MAGYNTMSKAEKNKITKEQLTEVSRLVKNLFCGIGLLWLAGLFVFHYFNIYHYFNHFIGITMPILLIFAIILIVYVNRKVLK
jgi:hypothetical protein